MRASTKIKPAKVIKENKKYFQLITAGECERSNKQAKKW
jgi:hypothetical protein